MKKLTLNKQEIANLSERSMNNIKAGLNAGTNNGNNPGYGWTSGCTDGCSTFNTLWNCTQQECSNNCLTKGGTGFTRNCRTR